LRGWRRRRRRGRRERCRDFRLRYRSFFFGFRFDFRLDLRFSFDFDFRFGFGFDLRRFGFDRCLDRGGNLDFVGYLDCDDVVVISDGLARLGDEHTEFLAQPVCQTIFNRV
jgi:hypothetical protein